MKKSKIDRHMDFLQEQKRLIERIHFCLDNTEELNDWEREFLESISERVMNGRTLTSAQEDTLQKVEYKTQFGQEAYWEEFGR